VALLRRARPCGHPIVQHIFTADPAKETIAITTGTIED
jgi:hypothetical protein